MAAGSSIRLSCLVAVCAVLVCSSLAEDHVTDTARRMLANYNDPSLDMYAKERNLETLANFYEQHRDRIQLNEAQRQQADELLRIYKEQKGSEILVDGVPIQGGPRRRGGKIHKPKVEVKLPETISINIGSSSAAGRIGEINCHMAIFALLFVVISYMYRS